MFFKIKTIVDSVTFDLSHRKILQQSYQYYHISLGCIPPKFPLLCICRWSRCRIYSLSPHEYERMKVHMREWREWFLYTLCPSHLLDFVMPFVTVLHSLLFMPSMPVYNVTLNAIPAKPCLWWFYPKCPLSQCRCCSSMETSLSGYT